MSFNRRNADLDLLLEQVAFASKFSIFQLSRSLVLKPVSTCDHRAMVDDDGLSPRAKLEWLSGCGRDERESAAGEIWAWP